jgi:hypothetical protein
MKIPTIYNDDPFKKNGTCKAPLFFAPNGKVFKRIKYARCFLTRPVFTKRSKQWHKGDALKLLRKQSGLEINIFAEKVGMDITKLRGHEAGQCQVTNKIMTRALEIIKKVAEI